MFIMELFKKYTSNQMRAHILFEKGWRFEDGVQLAYMQEELGSLYNFDDILEICDFLDEYECQDL